jgi:galactokinase
MTESGASSAGDYDISHPLVEELVGELNRIDGVAGARMMGGGEGGPALALIHRDALGPAAESLGRGFFQRHPSHLEGDRLQPCSFGPGARVEHL